MRPNGGFMTKVGSILLILVVGCSGFAIAADHQWQWIGPPAGTIQQIVPDRKNPNVWYTVNNGVLYRSTDGAKTWHVTPMNNLQDPYDASVVPVVVDPQSSNVFVLNKKPG